MMRYDMKKPPYTLSTYGGVGGRAVRPLLPDSFRPAEQTDRPGGPLLRISGRADGLARRCACHEAAVPDHEDARHQDVLYSRRWDFALLVRGPVFDGSRIENREVRVGTRLNPPLLLHGGHAGFQPLGGH